MLRYLCSNPAWNVFFSYTYPDEKKPKKTFSRSEVALLLNYQLANRNIGLHQYSISGVTNDQLIDGLNVLYGDFKNKGIKIRDAIYIVKKQIKGASSEDIEAALQYLRADKDDSKRFYTDKDGKKKYVSFP